MIATMLDPSPLFTTTDHSNGRAVIRLRGELELGSESAVAGELDRAIASRPTEVMLDLRELSFVDVRGVHAIEEARRRCFEHGCRPLLVPGPPQVQRVLSLCGVEGEFETVADPHQ